MSTRALGLGLLLSVAGCCPRTSPPNASLSAPSVGKVAYSIDRPPMLAIARAERLAATARPKAPPARLSDASDPPAETADADADANADADGMTRHITVRRRGLATEADLAAYLIRALDKTPNALHPTRALAQFRGPVRACEASDAGDRAQARQLARATVKRARRELKRCYAQRLTRDPRVIVKEPVGLVWEQAERLDATELKLDIDLEVAAGRAAVTGVHARNLVLYDDDVACMTDALGGEGEPRGGIATQVSLVLFTQRAYNSNSGPNPANSLSLAAAVFGWLELQHDATEEALALFEDAAWLYRRPEYQVLLGIAHERLGQHAQASKAYQAYLDGRPEASDAPEIRTRLRALQT